MKFRLAFLLLLIAPTFARSEVVEDNVQWTKWTNFPGGDYEARIIQSAFDGDYTSVWFTYKNANSSLQVTSWNLDEASSWYLVQAGQEFSPATVSLNQFPVLFAVESPSMKPPVTIPAGEFYLAAWTEIWRRPGYRAYGWLKVTRTGESLSLADSAFAYSEPGAPAGIYVGTSTAVPEPSAAMPISAALTMLWCRRSRTTQKLIRE
jgi:hypothetical protein